MLDVDQPVVRARCVERYVERDGPLSAAAIGDRVQRLKAPSSCTIRPTGSCNTVAMRVNRSLRVRVIAISILAFLFAQFSVAAYACPSAEQSSARAEMAPDCAGMIADDADPAAPNLCAEHCHYGQQSDQPRTPAVPAVALVALYAVSSPLLLSDPILPAAESSGLLVAPSPPHTILHCCFRI